ncbi:MAG: DNA gyrase subunit A [Clostridia bacterium]|nr:DNA gyrase subunit A [Clostridia bacterium]
MADYENQTIVDRELSAEMKKAYLEYAMSVIIGRALPDVRDGLKPVHRRILYTMHEAGLTPDKAYKKCAATVGDVLGKYHPHGDASVYDALVRLAQNFSMRYPLVDGQGNFGSVDGDPPAAYRYTEARMSKISLEMLTDIEKDTVDFMPNYDDSRKEPCVITSRFPNLLVNGSSGIAVAMATNIPPHNLTEVIDGIIAVIDDPNITIDELMNYIKGPDFPTAGLIMGKSGIRSAYHTGRGRILMRARAVIEELKNNQQQIIVTEIPYQVNKAKLVEKIGELQRDKRVEGIAEVRDESDREGMRIVIEVKRDANANVILNQLYKFTQLQESFCVNMIALVNVTEPKLLNLREVLDHYIEFQKDVIIRKTKFNLKKALEREHILLGLNIAIDNIDEVINTIRSAKEGVAEAKTLLMERFALSDEQAQAIVDMRLGRLSGLERQKIHDELLQVQDSIRYYNEVLADDSLVLSILKDDLNTIREKYGDDRRTEITASFDDIDDEDLIEEEDVAITLTHFGYVKRVPVDTYRSQRRGGRGIKGQQVRDEDFVENIMTTSTHNHILFFTNMGRMFKLKGYQIPEAGRQSKGTAIVNLLELESGEKVNATIALREFSEDQFLTFVTKNGIIKRSILSEYDTSRKNGFRAITLDEDDEVIAVNLTDGTKEIIVGTANGMAIRFTEEDARVMGRTAHGVRAIRLVGDDKVVGVCIADENAKLLVVSEYGYGKKTDFDEYKCQNRGGKGVLTYRITEQTGKLAGIKSVTDETDIMLITDAGVIIRMHTGEISTYSRVTKGVRLMRLNDDVKIVSLAAADREEDEEEDAEITEGAPEVVEVEPAEATEE